MHHGSRRGYKIRLADVVTLFFSLDHTADKFHQLLIGSSAAHQLVQIVVPHRKQAGANFAIGRNADAAAVSAEWMRDGGDDSNLSNAVVEVITACGFAACVRDLDQRPVLRHALDDFIQGNHNCGRPGSIFFEWHEFDETNDDAFFASKHAEG